ncbi:MAG TPA: UxaA family hydrolase, partial [bacterium]|nr:UxaA family hydrolase [bacterium]
NLDIQGASLRLPHTVMEGHRFAVVPIAAGDKLLSWGLPFGTATRPIAPGDYICNEKILQSLSQRNIDFALPTQANFKDYMQRYALDEARFAPGQQVPAYAQHRTFQGYARGGSRGVGTRNMVVVMGTTSLTAGYARALAERFHGAPQRFPHVEGVVAVAHTEGGGNTVPNNLDFVLRTLAGFMVNPNVGAILAADFGTEAVNNGMLERFMREHGYPLEDVPHRFISLQGDFQEELARGAAIIEDWLPQVNACRRTEQPVQHLRLGLQCGGSDAFSGVSGNPLAGWLAKETLKNGGSANLAETDELIGAEPYVLANVRDLETARRFLDKIEIFRQRAANHGHSAEGNPSGGNNFRGLYNIAIKSIGAARKKDPDVRLDYVIDYSQPMTAPGFYFMDSPGNDLESVAGQVGAGCNMILFTTGNGSITNHPFVPTIKIVTTTPRYQMLAHEMDVNAGRYQDGCPMEQLGQEAFDLMLAIASGQPCAGERSGQSQVSIWRDWAQNDGSQVSRILNRPPPGGKPLLARKPAPGLAGSGTFLGIRTPRGYASEQVGLLVPTSICSGQVARQIAERLNATAAGQGGISRYVALVHTEGCGAAGGYSEEMFLRTLLGHLVHPVVRKGLLLEHGCEKTHNDAVRHYLREHGVDDTQFGWASIQMDGGIEKVTDKVERWFASVPERMPPEEQEVGLEYLSLGLTSLGALPDEVARAFGLLAQQVVAARGTVVLPENATLLAARAFREQALLAPEEVYPTLGYGQPAPEPGLHVMEAPTAHAVETFTGLGATGVEVVLAHVYGPPLQSHPMIPVVQVSADKMTLKRFGRDLDLSLDAAAGAPALAGRLQQTVAQVASRRYIPRLFGQGNTDFQLTRGLLGLSL